MTFSTALQNVQGPFDLYEKLVVLNQKRPANRGAGGQCLQISKKDCKTVGIDWSFVESSCSLLNLTLARDGRWGFIISNI